MPDQPYHDDANRLYWETNASVAEIADQLAISRRALYDAIEPRPAHAPCPECGVILVFRNRTAAERRRAECLECEMEMALEELAGGGAPGATAGPTAGEAARPTPSAAPGGEGRTAGGPTAPSGPGVRPSPVRERAATVSGNGAILGGSLLAGLALGAAAGYLIRKR
jgi:hypothetical protein